MININDIKVKLCDSKPPYFIHEGIACLFYFDAEDKDNDGGTAYVQEYFLNQLKEMPIADQEFFTKSFIEYISECYDYYNNIDHPFRNKIKEFNDYCDSKWSELSRYQNTLLIEILSSAFENISSKLSNLLATKQNIVGSDNDLVMNELKAIMTDPRRICEFQNDDLRKKIGEVISNKLREGAVDRMMRRLDEEDYHSCVVSVASFADKISAMITQAAAIMGVSESTLRLRIANFENMQFIKLNESINGFVKPCDDKWSRFEIYVNKGLWDLLLFIPFLYLSHIQISDSGKSSETEKAIVDKKDIPQYAFQMMETLLENNNKGNDDFFRMVEDSRKSEKHEALIATMIDSARDFVIGHEFGHILVNVCPEKVSEDILGASILFNKNAELLLQIVGISNKSNSFSNKKWIEEFAADRIGLKLCLKKNSKHPISYQICVGAAETVFQAMVLVEKYNEKIYGTNQHSKDTDRKIVYPPTIIRHKLLKLSIPDEIPDIFGDLVDEVNDYIVSNW